MPVVNMTIPETSQSISRPIVYDIIKQIKSIIKIQKDTKIFFPGDIQKMNTSGSSIDSDGSRQAIFNNDRYLFIEVEEDYDRDSINSTAINQPEHIPVFTDPKLEVQVTPVYSTTDITINFKYQSTSKTEILRWRDDMRMKVSQLRDINLHNLTYHYLLPMPILSVLETVYDLRESNVGYGDGMAEYITNHSSQRLTVIGDLVNKSAKLAISETQMRVVGIFGFDTVPEKPEREDTGNWIISFSYKFSYEKPIAVSLRYPVMVHNQLMPRKFTEFIRTEYSPKEVDRSYSASLNGLHGFESDTIMTNLRKAYPIIRLPKFDDYILTPPPNSIGSIFIALTEVGEDKRSLFNLKELGDLVIDCDIIEFIKESEWPYIHKPFESIINVSLYRNKDLTYHHTIECTSDLDIRSRKDLNLRDQHRVRFSLITDLTMLTKEALDRLRNYPKALVKIISAMNEILKNSPDFNKLGDLKKISLLHFNPIYAILTGYSLDSGKGNIVPKNNGGSTGGNSNSSNHNYYGAGNYYGGGLPVNDRTYANNIGGIFKDIDPRLVENYRRNRIGNNKIMTTSIVSFRKN